MKVVLDEKIKAHMKENGISDIVVETAKRGCWSGSYTDIFARFANEDERNDLDRSGFRKESTELGNVYFDPGVKFIGEEVKLSLRNYLWTKAITFRGVMAK